LSSFKVTTKGPGAIYAEVTTVAEATSFKDAMIELMESSQLQEEMRDIYSEAGQLENVSRSLARILDFTCDQYGKYGKLLKRKKDCPVCQVIYE
jgi:rubrerythrin